MKINFSNNKTKDEVNKVYCSSCKNSTKHIVLTSITAEGSEYMYEEYTFHWETNYEIIQCLGCETISFRSRSTNSEHDDYEGRPIETVQLYPKRSKDTLIVKTFMNVPYNLQRIYTETIESFNYGNLTLCGAGVRALVEGICQENGITGGNIQIPKNDGSIESQRRTTLEGKINGLYESGKLTSQHADILHEHRYLGNEAVHELNIPSKDDLSLAIEIVENIFDNLYEIPSKGLILKRKRLGR